MTCERCGSPSNGRLCASCEQMDRVERNHEHQKRSDGGAIAQPDADDDLDVPPAPKDVRPDNPMDITEWCDDDTEGENE